VPKPSEADLVSGSIRPKGPNRWQIRVSAGSDPGTGRYRYVHKTVEGSKRVAQRAADQLAAEVQYGMHGAARGTVANLLENWMLHLETQDRAPSAAAMGQLAVSFSIPESRTGLIQSSPS
jgi:hypothetical protein